MLASSKRFLVFDAPILKTTMIDGINSVKRLKGYALPSRFVAALEITAVELLTADLSPAD